MQYAAWTRKDVRDLIAFLVAVPVLVIGVIYVLSATAWVH
jgi:hypothetical protein